MSGLVVYGRVTTVVVTAPDGAGLVGAGGDDDGNVTTIGGVAPGGAGVVGAVGINGLTGDVGITGTGTGVPGTTGLSDVPLPGAGGASAAILLVRKATFVPRAFNGLVPGEDMPPAAGSISSSQAPHLRTEST